MQGTKNVFEEMLRTVRLEMTIFVVRNSVCRAAKNVFEEMLGTIRLEITIFTIKKRLQGNCKNRILCSGDLIEKTFRISIKSDHASEVMWIGVCFSHHPLQFWGD